MIIPYVIEINKKQKSENGENDLLITNKEQTMKYRNITIFKNPKASTWYARFRFQGKQYYVSGKTKMETYNKLKKEINTKSKTSKLLENKIIYTFKEWYKIWFDTFKKGNVKETTIKSYNSLLHNIDGKFYNLKIDTINSVLIKQQLENTYGTRQQQKLYEFLKDIFERAVEQKLIDDNPVKLLQKPKHNKKETNALTPEQEQAFIYTCKSLNNKTGDYFLVTLYQGLRKGEALGLKFNDIDFKNMTLKIDESFSEATDDTSTKNATSNRIMPLLEKTKQILNKYTSTKEDDRIFTLSGNYLQKKFKEILKLSNLPDFKIHELRHTFITRCQEKNIPEHIIQQWVGHQIGSVITKRVYTHKNLKLNNDFAKLLDG